MRIHDYIVHFDDNETQTDSLSSPETKRILIFHRPARTAFILAVIFAAVAAGLYTSSLSTGGAIFMGVCAFFCTLAILFREDIQIVCDGEATKISYLAGFVVSHRTITNPTTTIIAEVNGHRTAYKIQFGQSDDVIELSFNTPQQLSSMVSALRQNASWLTIVEPTCSYAGTDSSGASG